ncbi:MAG: hypothetical protein DWH81_10030 [Planctomycetota bacterium]|nr:MAG: hypothetical protein DWH81_10030 [Planctomycetota bacterium]
MLNLRSFKQCSVWFMAAILTVVLPQCLQAETPFTPLLNQVPDDANILVMIDSEQIRRSVFGKAVVADKSAGDENSHIVSGEERAQVLLAARIRGFRNSMIDWQKALIKMNVEPSIAGLAASYSGSVETLGKRDYAVLPYGAVAVSTDRNVLAVLTPPDRQQVSRAVQMVNAKKKAQLSSYMTSAAEQVGGAVGAIVAVDLNDMFSQSQIRSRLAGSETFRNPPIDVGVAASFLASIKGLVLQLAFRKDAQATLTVDFSQEPPEMSKWGKELIIEILSNNGAYFEDIDNWTFTQGKNKIVLEGPISISGIRQVLSLIDFPTEVPSQYQPGAVLTSEQEQQRTAKATLTRFRATQKLVADLRKDDRARTGRIGESAMWFDRYARQIETLPSLYVDPDMLQYCDDVVMRLRVQSTHYRMASSRINQQSAQQNQQNVDFWGNFNNFYGDTYNTWTRQESDFARTRRFERAGSASNRAEQFQAIDEDTVAIRRKMVEKYKVEF